MNALAQVSGELSAHTEVPRMREAPRFLDSLDLVALPTAVAVARLFVADTMRRWGAMFVEPDMEAITAELVGISVQQTGPAEDTSWKDIHKLGAVTINLIGFRRHIAVHVVDTHDEKLVLPALEQPVEDSSAGLVNALAKDWGSRLTPRGRLMWAELDVYERTSAGLPHRNRKPTPHSR